MMDPHNPFENPQDQQPSQQPSQQQPFGQSGGGSSPTRDIYGKPLEQKTNTLAIIGFICSFFFGIAGIVFCIIALSQIKKDPNQKGKELAIAGIVISICIGIIPMLAMIGALAYFGVMSPDKFLPENCIGPAGMQCFDNDVIGSTNTIMISSINNMGKEIVLTSLSVDGTGTCSQVSKTTVIMDGVPLGEIESGVTIPYQKHFGLEIRCAGFEKGSSFSDKFDIGYEKDGMIHHGIFSVIQYY